MTRTIAYVSSSYPDLVEYRDAARRLLSQYHFDGRGMGDYDYTADPNLYEKCVTDAANADLLILIVGYRYGTLFTPKEKSFVELEYEAARNASREVLAFVFSGEPQPDFDDRRGSDGGAAIEAFRRRLVADGLLVSTFSNLQEFETLCGRALLAFRTKLLDRNESEPRASNVDFFLRTYLDALVERHKALDDFYVPLAATTTSSRPSSAWRDVEFGGNPGLEEPEPAEARREVHVEDVAEALDVHRQFYLAAEPGSGKSLSLIALELAAARQYLRDSRSRFPLRIDVAAWTNEQDFEALIWRELKDRTRVQELPPAHLLLLIDGVIDSAAASHDRLQKIEAWLAAHSSCKAVLAVRTQRSFVRRLPVVRLSRLDNPRAAKFVEKRLGRAKADALLPRLGFGPNGKQKESDIATLARNPFNLSLICDLEERQKFPPNRVALIQSVVITKHSRETRRGRRPEWPTFVEALGSVAFAMIRQRSNLAADVAWLGRTMSLDEERVGEVVTLAKDCGVISEHADRARYEFSHRLYLEYFAAEFLRLHRERLEDVLEEPRYEDGRRISRRFDEVIQALVQLEHDVGMIKTISACDPFLAASCLPLLPDDSEDKLSQSESAIVNSLGALLTHPTMSAEAIATLAQIGSPAIIVLRRLLKTEPHFVRRRVVSALAQIRHPLAIEAVLGALCDSNAWVRADARDAVRRFDQPGRELVLQSIKSHIERWRADPKLEIDAAIDELIDDVHPDFAAAIAAAAGIDLKVEDEETDDFQELAELAAEYVEITAGKTAGAQPLAVPEPAEEPEPEDAYEPPSQEHAVSWGYQWADEWEADRGNPELAASGKAWLRGTSVRDPGWALVWRSLWNASIGDHDLEWLGRDWLERVPKRAGPWAQVWQALFKARPDDAILAGRGNHWLLSVRANQTGWNYVWSELWAANSNRGALTDLGFWWLNEADARGDEHWFIIWKALWDQQINRSRLDAIGRQWLGEGRTANQSWGYVWPRLWEVSRGDQALLQIGKKWLAAAPADHRGWAHIWEPLRKYDPKDAELQRQGRQWLRGAPAFHGGWNHVWELLWGTNGGDAELVEMARTWLSAAPPLHHGWSRVWSALWMFLHGDSQLVTAGLEWLKQTKVTGGWSIVCRRLLESFPGDTVLLGLAREGMLQPGASDVSTWRYLWQAQWDFGGEREWLDPLARSWLGDGTHTKSGFTFVWERLWAEHPNDEQLRRTALQWLRVNSSDPTWPWVAEPYAAVQPRCPELLEIAKSIVEGSDASHNWPIAWRILADATPADDDLIRRGRTFVDSNPPTRKGWARVWCRLPITSNLLPPGWALMQPQFFQRRSWPDVWEVLWVADPGQRQHLAELAGDWLLSLNGKRAHRIKHWSDIPPLLQTDDAKRRDAVAHTIRIQKLRGL